MYTVACHTLGCKVNQYDTQAMEELLAAAGFRIVPFHEPADIYLVNTCTVTGTGDKKCMQLARRLKREHPSCCLVLCGCMAQQMGAELFSLGADLVIGTQYRGQIVSLLNTVLSSGQPLCAVDPLPESMPYESLQITTQQDHTRAVLKIQEGCRNRCSYCVIPDVRGPIRSRPLQDICSEASRLSAAGFREVVLTGIHLSSYGRDFSPVLSLLDVIRSLEDVEGILRIRLGSLEPGISTPEFASALRACPKLCPQFHLALQSGSDSVLRRMRRQYNSRQYLQAVENLRAVFPRAAFTTDILTGFPGETDQEFQETVDMIEKVGFARIHVFPYSPRPGTPAAAMPSQLSEGEKQARARRLIAVGKKTAACYQRQWIGEETELLPEECVEGFWEGYSPEYLRICLDPAASCRQGIPVPVRIVGISSHGLRAVISNTSYGKEGCP